MKIISRNELSDYLLYFILNNSKAYKEGILCKNDAERFSNELSKWLAKKITT